MASPSMHGAELLGDGTARFRVWAPRPQKLQLVLGDLKIPLQRGPDGFAETIAPAAPGMHYAYELDGESLRPDPASAALPEGVHGRSALWSPRFDWTDAPFKARPLSKWVIYELHVGTFTREGTFDALIPALDYLRDLGVNAVELMPVAPFAGARNWGYDGVSFQAVHEVYGGAAGLQRLVNQAHARGLAVILDVVFNHLGPEGNYLPEFGPYFSERHHTPWGPGLNVDGPEGPAVRSLIVESGLRWFRDFHLDALRLDAVHGILDDSPQHLIALLEQRTEELAHQLGRPLELIAEYDLGQSKIVRPRAQGGWQLPAQWCDDFHHALHARLTGERQTYFVDFGTTAQLGTALRQGYVYTGQPSRFRKGPFGTPTADLPPERFVVCSQNHDQVGNRALGERLDRLVDEAKLRLAAAAVLLAPQIPLLFMGQEYGETAPFLYFTSHTDAPLAKAVSEGRRREFPHFSEAGSIPDPQDPETFARSRVDRELRFEPAHAELHQLYRDLIALRHRHPALGCWAAEVEVRGELILVSRRSALGDRSALALAFEDAVVELPPFPGMQVVLDTSWTRYGGEVPQPGAAQAGATPMRPWSARVLVSPPEAAGT